MAVTVNAQPIELVLKNTVERIDILVVDADGVPVNATGLTFELRYIDDTVVYSENFITAPSRIQNPSTGRYYFPMGDVVTTPNPETGTPGEYLAVWAVTGPAGSETVNIVQKAWVVTAYSMSLISDLRLQIDKAAKMVSDDPTDPCYLGYTDSMLMQFLCDGLTIWNMYEPYPTFMSLDSFPVIYRQGLIDSALLVGVASQELFAIDTDIPNYCFVAGTGVTLSDGTLRAIEDIRVGDQVLDRRGLPAVVEAAWEEPTPPAIIDLTLWGSRKLSVTENHTFPVWAWPRTCGCDCGEEVKPGRLYRQGHHTRVANPRRTEELPQAQVVYGAEMRIPEGYEPVQRLRADEIRSGDFLLIPRKFDPVETQVTVEQARLLGYYAAEGCLTDRESGSPANMCLTFHEDEQATWGRDLEATAQQAGVPFTWTTHSTARGVQFRTRTDYGRCTATREWVELARTHVGEGSASKRLSEDLMRWPIKLKREFLRGLFRGDGTQTWSHITKRGHVGHVFTVSHSTASISLHTQVQLLLAQLGIPTRTDVAPEHDFEKDGNTYHASEQYRLTIPMPFAAEFAQWVWGTESKAAEFSYGNERQRPPRPACMIDDDFVYVPVQKVVRRSNTDPVFNLTISGDHSYLVHGLATFNSAQGAAFVINHQGPLANYLSRLSQRLDKLIPIAKLKLVRSGSVHVEASPNFRLATLLNAAPSGSLFRNMYFRA